MGRPRLHATAQERVAAARKYRQDYYERNKKTISVKMAAKYKARRAGKPSRINHEPAKTTQLSGHSPQLERHVTEQETSISDSESEHESLPDSYLRRIGLQYVFELLLVPYSRIDGFNLRQRIQDVQTAVAETTALHAEDYFEHLYSSLTKNSNDYQLRLSIISDALKLLEKHSLQTRMLEAELVQENGTGKLLSQAQELTQTLRDMTGAAEELWCFIVDDPDATKLIQQYSRGELRFQRPNVDK
ncbi:hypothetical protein DFJ58DRAFT_39635 [Suillus subalutaceus]|uniref:uncharacterized protein n=1 Tax=Suillus subalutaceus TaxID=48586 RepID=UPI001B879B91|nr:uncharacterized protein DFJ58DRAFT_39635 [Suillus subalutaceus]KAG1843377.1 hypothetical protein DFJ58DRAFT_39635 [Suillus subalutaceus]